MHSIKRFLIALTFLLAASSARAQCSNTSLGNGFTCIQTASGVAHSATSKGVAFGSNNGTGDTLLYGCGQGTNVAGIQTVADSNSNTIVSLKQSHAPLTAGMVWWIVVKSNAGANTVTCTGGGGLSTDLDLIIVEISGAGTTNPDQNQAGASNFTGSQSTVSTGNIVPTNAPQLLATYVYDYNTSHGWTVNNSFSIVQTTTNTGGGECSGLAFLSVASTGTYSATWTNTGSAGFLGALAISLETPQPSSARHPIRNIRYVPRKTTPAKVIQSGN